MSEGRRRETLESTRMRRHAAVAAEQHLSGMATESKYDREVLGKYVSIRWTAPPKWFEGKCAEFSAASNLHLIAYKDGDTKWHNLGEEEEAGQLRWVEEPNATPAHPLQQRRRSPAGASLSSSSSSSPAPRPDEETKGLVGASIEIFWPLDSAYYHATVRKFIKSSGKHEVCYSDDGVVEKLDLRAEKWRRAAAPQSGKRAAAPPLPAPAATGENRDVQQPEAPARGKAPAGAKAVVAAAASKRSRVSTTAAATAATATAVKAIRRVGCGRTSRNVWARGGRQWRTPVS